MLMVELIRKRLQLTSADDAIDTPHHIKSWTRKKRLDWLLGLLQPIRDELCKEFDPPNMDNVIMRISVDGTVRELHIPATMRG